MADIWALIHYLKDHQAEAGDGMVFPQKVYNQAAQSLNEIRSEGGPKTGNSCKSKWNNDVSSSFPISDCVY